LALERPDVDFGDVNGRWTCSQGRFYGGSVIEFSDSEWRPLNPSENMWIDSVYTTIVEGNRIILIEERTDGAVRKFHVLSGTTPNTLIVAVIDAEGRALFQWTLIPFNDESVSVSLQRTGVRQLDEFRERRQTKFLRRLSTSTDKLHRMQESMTTSDFDSIRQQLSHSNHSNHSNQRKSTMQETPGISPSYMPQAGKKSLRQSRLQLTCDKFCFWCPCLAAKDKELAAQRKELTAARRKIDALENEIKRLQAKRGDDH